MTDDINSFLGITESAIATAEHSPIDNSTQCYIFLAGQQQGPYMPQQITEMWRSGTLTADTLVFPTSHQNWIPINIFLTRIALKIDKTTLCLLTFFLGGIGVHKFYLGNWGWGVLYLGFCWTFIPGLAAFVEFIRYITLSEAIIQLRHQKSADQPFGFL